LGNLSVADAFDGNSNLAVVLGSASTAMAFNGSHNLAAALGAVLSATAMRGSVINIVSVILGTLFVNLRFFVRGGPSVGSDGDLLKFDRDPREDTTAEAYRYHIHGGWWVPDTTGVLGELVRRTTQYRQIPEDEVMEVKMRLAVNAASRVP